MESTNSAQVETSNPQNTGSTDEAADASDLQGASQEGALGSNSTQGLSVQQTGEPLSQQAQVSSPSSVSVFLWVFGIVAVIAAVFLLSKLMKESDEEVGRLAEEVVKTPVSKPVRTTRAKKKTSKKGSSPNQRRKKTSKKKR